MGGREPETRFKINSLKKTLKSIDMTNLTCAKCSGTGRVPGRVWGTKECSDCKGSGDNTDMNHPRVQRYRAITQEILELVALLPREKCKGAKAKNDRTYSKHFA